eukprot:scaffold28787_cov67-Phaeocystis_antarctica.AAC.4
MDDQLVGGGQGVCDLPSRKKGMVRYTGRRAAGGGRPRRKARGEVHPEHIVHVCDAGGVEAQWLVERLRLLPRVERGACGAGRGARVGGQQAVNDRHGEERTPNM